MRTTVPVKEGCATLLAALGASATSLIQKTTWSSLVVFLYLCAASGTLQAQVTSQWIGFPWLTASKLPDLVMPSGEILIRERLLEYVAGFCFLDQSVGIHG